MAESTSARTVPESKHTTFVRITEDAGLITAHVVGPSVGQREAPLVQDALADAISRSGRIRFLVIDLSDVGFLNSMGLGMCIDARNRVAAVGGTTIISGVGEELHGLFKMTKTDRLFKIVTDRAKLAKLIGR
ncbi:MAG: STAS domain-containing protein [Phycisphaerales bacterium]|nr:STAS domain-containing protein [Phycisphaerales bacterium]